MSIKFDIRPRRSGKTEYAKRWLKCNKNGVVISRSKQTVKDWPAELRSRVITPANVEGCRGMDNRKLTEAMVDDVLYGMNPQTIAKLYYDLGQEGLDVTVLSSIWGKDDHDDYHKNKPLPPHKHPDGFWEDLKDSAPNVYPWGHDTNENV